MSSDTDSNFLSLFIICGTASLIKVQQSAFTYALPRVGAVTLDPKELILIKKCTVEDLVRDVRTFTDEILIKDTDTVRIGVHVL